MVYFLQYQKLTKIGIGPPDRPKQIQMMCPVQLTLVKKINCYKADAAIEKWLHAFFFKFRHHGEWFELPEGWEPSVDELLKDVPLDGRCVYVRPDGTRCKNFPTSGWLCCSTPGHDHEPSIRGRAGLDWFKFNHKFQVQEMKS